jgi:hypothetical protein
VTLKSGVETLGWGCFRSAHSLATVVFEDPCCVSVIEACAFQFCSSLISICIPSSVVTIGNECFGKCDKLTDVTFAEGCRLRIVGKWPFGLSLKHISIPRDAEHFDDIYHACHKLYKNAKIQGEESDS